LVIAGSAFAIVWFVLINHRVHPLTAALLALFYVTVGALALGIPLTVVRRTRRFGGGLLVAAAVGTLCLPVLAYVVLTTISSSY
jgi:hypothetical protein